MSDMSVPVLPLEGSVPPAVGQDLDLDRVEKWLLGRSQVRARIGVVIRLALDQVLDAERTGRFRLDGLSPSEIAYLPIRFAILLRDEFDLPGISISAVAVDGVDVGILLTAGAGWRSSTEGVAGLRLLLRASDNSATYSLGIIRTQPEDYSPHGQLQPHALARVRWFVREAGMPQNILQTLDPGAVQAIFATPGKGNGQVRINELFRRVQDRVIPRQLTMIVAHQSDPMKRPREARRQLQSEGIVILGHWKRHADIAEQLGLPVPKRGELVAVRLVAATPHRQLGGRRVAVIGGSNWVVALPDEDVEVGPEPHY